MPIILSSYATHLQRLDILETLSAAVTELAAQKDTTAAGSKKRALITDLSEGGHKQELRPLYSGGSSGPVRSVRGVPELRMRMGSVRLVEYDHDDEEEAREGGENRLAVGARWEFFFLPLVENGCHTFVVSR